MAQAYSCGWSALCPADILQFSGRNTCLVVQVRQAQADKHSSIPAIPVTVRQLEAVIRISESIARMQLLPVATQEHVAKAIQLFNFSTMEAVKSGLHDNLVRLPGTAGMCASPWCL